MKDTALEIQSKSHPYTVEQLPDFATVLQQVKDLPGAQFLVDGVFADLYQKDISANLPADKIIKVEATEPQKSFEQLTPIFLKLLDQGFKRNGVLVVIGGGVLQDIGCFIASVLFRGLRWELIPTTLLAQADSCIGSKSSINIGSYKNQIGTFYPPHRVLLTTSVLKTLPWDEIRSGLGEVIKLQLLHSEAGFQELMQDLENFSGQDEVLAKWVVRSMAVKKPFIEADEYDRGVRNLLNYGHTFGHAYESATHYGIPHGISVVLGMLTATYVSANLGLVEDGYYQNLKKQLAPWYKPYGETLAACDRNAVFKAIKHDKKNTGTAINCILTRGPGKMEKTKVSLEDQLTPLLNNFITKETN